MLQVTGGIMPKNCRKEKYDLDDSELRPYFELNNVMNGAFTVANKLYGITFTEIEDIPLPHPDAVAFEVKEADGSHTGVLYLDFHPRASKKQGAWCGGYRGHKVLDGKEDYSCNYNGYEFYITNGRSAFITVT